VTGWSTFAFVLLIVSGFVLWIPRRISGMSLARAATPACPATLRARYFNWHTVVGFWCAPVLLVLAVTGVVLAFPWANRLLYTIAGSPLPQAVQRNDGAPADGGRAAAQTRAAATAPNFRAVDTAWASAVTHLPTWRSIVVRIPPRADMPLSFTITDAAHWNRFDRSQMTVSGKTGEVLRFEPYEEVSRGQKWRGWARFAHTGELGGLTGQVLAGAASAGAAVLVWTGMSLALRRLLRSGSVSGEVVGAPVAVQRPRAAIPEPNRQVEQS